MIGRWVGRFILVASVAVAVGLLLLWWNIGAQDWLIGSASGGTYREFRFERDHVRLTWFIQWRIDDPLQHGRPMETTGFKIRPGSTRDTPLVLLDGAALFLAQGPASRMPWWETGVATMPAPPEKYILSRTATTAIASPTTRMFHLTLPTTQNGPVVNPAASTARESVTITIDSPPPFAAAPSLEKSAKPMTAQSDLLDTLQSSTEVTMRPKTKSPPPALAGSPMRFGFGFAGRSVSYPYESLAIPYWAAAIVALTPAWIWLLATAFHWRQRRYRKRRGLCVQCGYDLRGSSTLCPECGLAFTPVLSS